MFWEVTLVERVRIQPMKLANDLTETTVGDELKKRVEGRITPETGIILAVQNIESIGNGIISARSGFANFEVKYRALLFRPHKDQIVDAVIVGVTENGIRADAGPMELFIARKSINPDFEFDMENNSFTKTTRSETENSTIVLMKNTKIRVQIINTKPTTDFTKLTATAKMNEPGLGFISQ